MKNLNDIPHVPQDVIRKYLDFSSRTALRSTSQNFVNSDPKFFKDKQHLKAFALTFLADTVTLPNGKIEIREKPIYMALGHLVAYVFLMKIENSTLSIQEADLIATTLYYMLNSPNYKNIARKDEKTWKIELGQAIVSAANIVITNCTKIVRNDFASEPHGMCFPNPDQFLAHHAIARTRSIIKALADGLRQNQSRISSFNIWMNHVFTEIASIYSKKLHFTIKQRAFDIAEVYAREHLNSLRLIDFVGVQQNILIQNDYNTYFLSEDPDAMMVDEEEEDDE